MPPRNRPAAGAASRGGAAEHPNSQTALRAIAALGPAVAARGACAREMGPSEAMARVDVRSPGFPSGCARGAQGAGWRVCRRTHALRELTRRSCLNGARQRAVSSAAHPVTEHPRLPRSAAKGSQTAGSPFLWFLSFGDAKERDSPAGANSRPPPSIQARRTDQRTSVPRLRQAQPERAEETLQLLKQ